jgi:hypothetical protein
MSFVLHVILIDRQNIENSKVVATVKTQEITDAPLEVMGNFFFESYCRLFGIFDNGLLGKAYRSFQWSHDKKYNDYREVKIKKSFLIYFATNVFKKIKIENKEVWYIALDHSTYTRWNMFINAFSGKFYSFSNFKVKGTVKCISLKSSLSQYLRQWFANHKHSYQR